MANFVVLNTNELNKVNGGLVNGDGGCVIIPGLPRIPTLPRRRWYVL
jgi:bacteriocin-like protein